MSLATHLVPSNDSDQTTQVHRLTGVIVEHSSFVSFAVPRLNYGTLEVQACMSVHFRILARTLFTQEDLRVL